jgi:hypothetical protein
VNEASCELTHHALIAREILPAQAVDTYCMVFLNTFAKIQDGRKAAILAKI